MSDDPLKHFPIFQRGIVRLDPKGEKFSEDPLNAPTISNDVILQFARANLNYSDEEIMQIGAIAMANIARNFELNTGTSFALTYLQGVLDGVRLMMSQARQDQAEVQKGRVM